MKGQGKLQIPGVAKTSGLPLPSASAKDRIARSAELMALLSGGPETVPAFPDTITEDGLPSLPEPTIVQRPDMSASGVIQRMSPPGYTGQIQLPQHVDPAVIARAMDAMQKLSLVQGIAGFAPATPYSVKSGRRAGPVEPGPVWDAAKSAASLPLMQEQMRVEHANKASALMNQLAMQGGQARMTDIINAMGFAKEEALAKGAEAERQMGVEQAGLGRTSAEKIGAAHDAASIERAKIAAAAGAAKQAAKPPNPKIAKDMDLLLNGFDHLRNLKDLATKYGPAGTARAKLSPMDRAANAVADAAPWASSAISTVIPSAAPTEAAKEYRADMELLNKSADALKAVSGMSIEGSRRMHNDMTKMMNKQFPDEASAQRTVDTQLGTAAKHYARNYRDLYNQKPDWFAEQGLPLPDAFEEKIMEGLIAPPSSKIEQPRSPPRQVSPEDLATFNAQIERRKKLKKR